MICCSSFWSLSKGGLDTVVHLHTGYPWSHRMPGLARGARQNESRKQNERDHHDTDSHPDPRSRRFGELRNDFWQRLTDSGLPNRFVEILGTGGFSWGRCCLCSRMMF